MHKLAAAAVVVMCLAAPARAADDFEAQTTAQLEAGIEAKHPASYIMLAAKLFQAGRRDDAVFWFYLGQLRYRTHLAARRASIRAATGRCSRRSSRSSAGR